MKIRIVNYLVTALAALSLLMGCAAQLFADNPPTTFDAPTYRGKVVLVVDKTMVADPDVNWRIERLTKDLIGDGWRVLRHDVERGPELYAPLTLSGQTAIDWAQRNAPRVREVRALIKADYDAAPGEVKNVFLIGHIPVPYSGTGIGVTGMHYSGALPSDTFYGEMVSGYGADGWSDYDTQTGATTDAPWLPQVLNLPHDGKFDQNSMPSPMKLGVGRVDLYGMQDFGINETTLISRYLDKDHDFRMGVFSVQRRAILAGWADGPFCETSPNNHVVKDNFGANNVLEICDDANHWFPNVSAPGQDYLLGYGGGYAGGANAEGIGSSTDIAGGDPINNFEDKDSRVVFLNLYGSWFGNWEENGSFLKAPLANPYDPANGRYGYGLTVLWWFLGLNEPSIPGEAALTQRTLGATIGEAVLKNFSGTVSFGLMGDPTLRMHTVLPPTTVSLSKTDTSVTLTWTASADASVTGYNIYQAPTRLGPYTLANTGGPVTASSFTVTRTASPAPPDNFYMVRAVKTEVTPVGNYLNMSEGVIVAVGGDLAPFISILTQPIDQKVVIPTVDGIANATAFTVDAIGCDKTGSSTLRYQWYKGSSPLFDDGHFQGVNTRALLIRGVQASDVGAYHAVITVSSKAAGSTRGITSVTSSTASLSVDQPPIAVDDAYQVIRNTPQDLDVLSNDTDSDDGNAALSITATSVLDLRAGTVAINSDHRTIHFTPSKTWLGPVTFTYNVSDGFIASRATVTLNVVPKPGPSPTITPSTIPDQTLEQYATKEISFSIADANTDISDLQISASSSDPAVIAAYNLSIMPSGAGNVLRIHASASTGSCTVTLSVRDLDNRVTTSSFLVTVAPVSSAALVPAGLQSDGFHFTVVGPANSPVEIDSSDDLVTWTSLGKFTLNGNSYDFVDTAAVGSVSHRFYVAATQNGCSVNTIGFVTLAVPSGASLDLVANQFVNPFGNTIDVLFGALPNRSSLQKWDLANQTYIGTGKLFGSWTPVLGLEPGEGAIVRNGSSTAVSVTFYGDVRKGQQVSASFPTAGKAALMSSIIPRAGSLDSLGFPAAVGDQIQKLNVSGQVVTVATYGASGWDSVPNVDFGESFFLLSGSSAARTWNQNFSGCIPNVSIASPANGSIFVGPASISLAATATADSGIAKVEFFQGNVSLGLGTQTGNSFTLSWNSPGTGSYSITAHATDNNGITTISVPVTITVNSRPTLGSESYSSGTFQFTINGSAGVSVELLKSDDLVAWTPLGTVTLAGGSYNFTDTSAGSVGQRFYRVQENGVCSANTIGFISVALPAGKYVAVANQLNNPAGNTVGVLFAGLPNRSGVQKWDPSAQTYIGTQKSFGNWSQPGLTFNPGEGAVVLSASALTLTFVGDVPQGQQVNNGLPSVAGNYALISSVVPLSSSLVSLGFPAQAGDVIQQWDVVNQQWTTTATYNGTAWSPAAPTVQFGGAFFLQSGTSSTRSWTESFSPCP